ncbi:T-cell-interacting, activating receptor on myeloid cells protein 1-like [Numida meleagris]|uniref:T-cell-interacting, activating receptor on myeloid cells protein 1-like n=1 Tax=Numida meleagris TaxID=8996 RepID=UPI000B3E12EF|nr:T-cell-interacting, activating receptor on myeloid cells protein 1-like [Numida meleagris]
MAPMALALILGWCLVAASRAQQVPRPSLSLHPSQGVSLGDTVTLRCHLPRMAAWVWLYQDRGWTHNKYKDKKQDVAEFSFISTSREHAGTYRCQYHVSEPLGISEQSDPVELVLTDHGYPPPSISISPKEGVGMGTNVTIRCWNRDDGVTFLLHKDGLLSPTQHQDLDAGGTATFIIFGVTPADAGTYRCSYRPWAHPFVSSPLGDSVTLQLTPTPASPGTNGESCGILAVAVAGGCATALTFTEPNRSSKASEVQVPPGDNKRLTCPELQAAIPSFCRPGASTVPQHPVICLGVGSGGPLCCPPHRLPHFWSAPMGTDTRFPAWGSLTPSAPPIPLIPTKVTSPNSYCCTPNRP